MILWFYVRCCFTKPSNSYESFEPSLPYMSDKDELRLALESKDPDIKSVYCRFNARKPDTF